MLRSCDAPARIALDKQRIALLDQRMPSEIAVRHERADAQTAVRGLDQFERQVRDVDQPGRALDVVLHQVEEVGASGDELRSRIGRDLPHGVRDVVARAYSKLIMARDLPAIACRIAATMLG